jgi:hypothetical protein
MIAVLRKASGAGHIVFLLSILLLFIHSGIKTEWDRYNLDNMLCVYLEILCDSGWRFMAIFVFWHACVDWLQAVTIYYGWLQIHLFDINVPGKIRFQESEVLSPGNSLTCFKTRTCSLVLTHIAWPAALHTQDMVVTSITPGLTL